MSTLSTIFFVDSFDMHLSTLSKQISLLIVLSNKKLCIVDDLINIREI